MLDSERRPRVVDLIAAQSTEYRLDAERRSHNAHLVESQDTWVESRDLEEYLELLPPFQRKNFMDLLREKPGSSVLDIGCGDNAVALGELVHEWPYLRVKATGITLPLDRKVLYPPPGVRIFRQDVSGFFAEHRDEKFDLIMSALCFQYLGNPYGALKQAYRSLNPGGHLLVHAIYQEFTPLVDGEGEEVKDHVLQKEMRDRGYDIEVTRVYDKKLKPYTFALRKSEGKPLLKLPIRPVPVEDLPKPPAPPDPSDPPLRYVYLFDPSMKAA